MSDLGANPLHVRMANVILALDDPRTFMRHGGADFMEFWPARTIFEEVRAIAELLKPLEQDVAEARVARGIPSGMMASGIVTPVQPDYGNGAVAMLTEALDLAKKGEITQVAIVALCADGGYKHLVSNEQSVSTMTLLGALTALQFHILGRHYE